MSNALYEEIDRLKVELKNHKEACWDLGRKAEEERDKLKAELSALVEGVSRTVFNLNSTLSLVTPHDDEPMAKQIHEDLSAIRDGLRALCEKGGGEDE